MSSSGFLSVIPTYGGKRIPSQLQEPRDEVASLTIWVATRRVGKNLEASLTMSKALPSSPTSLMACSGVSANILNIYLCSLSSLSGASVARKNTDILLAGRQGESMSEEKGGRTKSAPILRSRRGAFNFKLRTSSSSSTVTVSFRITPKSSAGRSTNKLILFDTYVGWNPVSSSELKSKPEGGERNHTLTPAG